MNSRYNKVFVIAPANFATGGVELAHQLVDVVNNKGGDAYIAYVEDGAIVPGIPVTPAYSSYNIKVADEIEDSENNILILPELFFDYVYLFDKINFGLWWMSVDNHYRAAHWKDLGHAPGGLRDKRELFKLYRKRKPRNKFKDLKKMEARSFHFYQSAYAQNHLYNLGFSKVLPLKDYINTVFLENQSPDPHQRKDIVLYNPVKGWKFTKKIREANPDITFVPLENLSREQLRELMQTAKLYIDFGNFPGKDRLPREAALNGACIITGKRGASRFYEDISIGEEYKFDDKVSHIPAISSKIREILSDYDLHTEKFNFFRQQILREKDEFYRQITEFFFKDPALK